MMQFASHGFTERAVLEATEMELLERPIRMVHRPRIKFSYDSYGMKLNAFIQCSTSDNN